VEKEFPIRNIKKIILNAKIEKVVKKEEKDYGSFCK